MSAHTPGPWLIDGNTVHASALVAMPSGTPYQTNRFFLQASRGHSPDGELISKEELAADVALIAAAPDLLEEHRRSLAAFIDLDSCLERAGYKVTSLERCLVQDGIRATTAAIAKAERKTS